MNARLIIQHAILGIILGTAMPLWFAGYSICSPHSDGMAEIALFTLSAIIIPMVFLSILVTGNAQICAKVQRRCVFIITLTGIVILGGFNIALLINFAFSSLDPFIQWLPSIVLFALANLFIIEFFIYQYLRSILKMRETES